MTLKITVTLIVLSRIYDVSKTVQLVHKCFAELIRPLFSNPDFELSQLFIEKTHICKSFRIYCSLLEAPLVKITGILAGQIKS